MIYKCIGNRRGEHGSIVSCVNTSDTPSRTDRPEWGYLCPQCLGTQYGRRTLTVEVPDVDHPNTPELEPFEMDPGNGYQYESEAEELAGLFDLELDIDGLF